MKYLDLKIPFLSGMLHNLLTRALSSMEKLAQNCQIKTFNGVTSPQN